MATAYTDFDGAGQIGLSIGSCFDTRGASGDDSSLAAGCPLLAMEEGRFAEGCDLDARILLAHDVQTDINHSAATEHQLRRTRGMFLQRCDGPNGIDSDSDSNSDRLGDDAFAAMNTRADDQIVRIVEESDLVSRVALAHYVQSGINSIAAVEQRHHQPHQQPPHHHQQQRHHPHQDHHYSQKRLHQVIQMVCRRCDGPNGIDSDSDSASTCSTRGCDIANASLEACATAEAMEPIEQSDFLVGLTPFDTAYLATAVKRFGIQPRGLGLEGAAPMEVDTQEIAKVAHALADTVHDLERASVALARCEAENHALLAALRQREDETETARFGALRLQGYLERTSAKLDRCEEDNQALRAELALRAESRLCAICLEETASHAALPCGHMALCVGCSSKVTYCPICRTHLQDVVRIFMV